MAWAASACQGGGNDAATKSPGPAPKSGSGSDDDEVLTIDHSTPMYLVSGEYLARVTAQLGALAPAQPAEPAADDPAAGALAVINAPTKGLAQTGNVLAAASQVMESLFGKAGFFKGAEVPGRADGAPRFFAVDAAADTVVAVSYDAATAPAPTHSAQVLKRKDAATYEQVLRLDFQAYTDAAGGRQARVRFDHWQAAMHVETGYDTAQLDVATVFRPRAPGEAAPAATVLRYATDGDDHLVQGAYVWARAASAEAARYPRYTLPVTGDTEVFALRLRAGGAFPAAQKLAFLPVETAADTVAVAPAAFDAHSYARAADAFLVAQVREKTRDPSCAGYGDILRARFAGAPPAAVVALPADVCEGGAATDAAVLAAVGAACDANTDPSVDPAVTLCLAWQERRFLQNPQALATVDGKRELSEAGAALSADQAALADRLAADGVPSTAALRAPAAPPPTRPAAELTPLAPAP